MARVVMLEALAFGLDRLSRIAEERGIDLVLLTFDRMYYRRQLARHSHVRVVDVDTFDIDAVRRTLDDLAPVNGLISNTDTWAATAELLAGERGFTNVLRHADRLRDKVWVRNTVVDAGLSKGRATRATHWLGLPERSWSGPSIVKDAAGTGSRDVLLARSPDEAEKMIARLAEGGVPPERVTVEPYAFGPLYSAETYTTSAGTLLFGITSRTISELPDFRELDMTYPVGRGTEWEDRVRRWVTAVLAAIGRGVGPAHVEFVDTGSGFEIVEVNSRLGGGLIGESIEMVNGISPYHLMISQALAPELGQQHVELARIEPQAAAFAQVDKHVTRPGRLGEILGIDDLAFFPGDVRWHEVIGPGTAVATTADQSANYGTVSATGITPGEALRRAHAGARHIRLVVE
jgi:biotin carboxylase